MQKVSSPLLCLYLFSSLFSFTVVDSFLSPSFNSSPLVSRSVFTSNAPSISISNTKIMVASADQVKEDEVDSDAGEEEIKSEKKVGKGVGFGKVSKAPKKEVKKSQQALQREAAAKSYDEQKKSGIPEYSIFLRELSNDDKERWLPVGSMTIPRSSKVEQALFDNEENLIKGALRLFPKTDFTGGVEYGYNLKAYPDEPIKIAERPQANSNLFVKYLENAMNPLNASGIGKKE